MPITQLLTAFSGKLLLMRLQQAFPDVKGMSDLVDCEPEEIFRKIAAAFDWELVDLGA